MSIADASAAPAARHHPPPGGAALAIEASGLVKRFGATPALAGVDLAVAPGTVYGLLGPNGAGKTTTVRILATLLAPDGGTATVAGFDVAAQSAAVRRRIALARQAATVDQDLTGAENLILLGRLAGLGRKAARARAAELLAGFGLGKPAARQVKTYSGGMRRRLDLAASLIVAAEVYFLDEPTTGLDPASRAQVHQIVRSLAAGGGILRIRLADPAQRADAGPVLSRLLGMPIQAGTDPAALTATILASPSGRPASERAAAAVTEVARSGIAVGEFALGQPSLDEVFLALTGYPGAGSDNAKEATS